MPKREYCEKSRKKTKYSSNSSDDERLRDSRRRYHDKNRARKSNSVEKSHLKYRNRKHDTSSSSSRSSTTSSYRSYSSSSSSSSSSSNEKKNHSKKIEKSNKQTPPLLNIEEKKFELDNLYKEKDKATVLSQIEADSFMQSSFKQSSKIVVDLQKDKILIQAAASTSNNEDESLIHPNFLDDDKKRVDKWIKKLHIYRNQ